jgi:hypothetical protein
VAGLLRECGDVALVAAFWAFWSLLRNRFVRVWRG